MAAVDNMMNSNANNLRINIVSHPQTNPNDVGSVSPSAVWRSVARKNLIAVTAFSVVVNLLMLTLPIYLFQLI